MINNLSPLVVLVDVDNVILDTERAILNVYNKRFEKDVKFEEIDTWNFFNDKVKKDFFEILNRDWFWDTVQPIQPMCDYVKELLSRPDLFKIKFVTATKPTNPALCNKLERAIEFTDIAPKDIIICNDKSLIHGDLMIDDYEENIKRSNCWINWLIDRPWNQEWCPDDNHGSYQWCVANLHTLNDANDLYQELENHRTEKAWTETLCLRWGKRIIIN